MRPCPSVGKTISPIQFLRKFETKTHQTALAGLNILKKRSVSMRPCPSVGKTISPIQFLRKFETKTHQTALAGLNILKKDMHLYVLAPAWAKQKTSYIY